MENILSSLNAPQIEAVEHTDGPLLVLAGAGTGKTKVLTTRIAHILYQGLAQPNQVMAVTFTNKAAREMVERIQALMGRPMPGMWLGTFHSLCVRILRKHPEFADLNRDFSIIDGDDQNRLCKQILTEKGLDIKKWPARQMVNTISRFKDNAWYPSDVPETEGRNFDGKIIYLYEEYQKRLGINNACDFGDLLLKVVKLFKENAELLDKYQNWFKYVLVDEYQDTNAVQYMLIRLLTMAHKNICVVGDDDQSIYAWRGAQVGNILRFERDFPGCKVVKLEQNYRSTSNILKAASSLIANNKERHSKTLWSEQGEGAKIEVHPLWDGKEEARMVADRIEREVGEGKTYHDMAVLLRTAAQTRSLEEMFVKMHIPYTIVGGLKFYDRKEIKDAIAYLRLVNSEKDGLAFERIVNVPKRGIGESALDNIRTAAGTIGGSLMEGSREAVRVGAAGRAAGKLKDFHQLIDYLRSKKDETTPDRLMELILDQSGYHDMLRGDKNKEEAQGRLENLKELIRAMQEYEDVEAFLEHVSLVMDNEDLETDMIRMTTVHAAKGLEFNMVFLPGFEEGLFPHQRSLNEEGEKGLEEERRLAYVAITRAKKELVISYASSRFMYGHFEPATASRFLEEIPASCTKQVGGGGRQNTWRAGSGSRYDQGDKYGTPLFGREKDYVPNAKPMDKAGASFALGERVFHQKFGYGRVKRQEGSGATEKLTIAFEKAGEKKLLTALAKLTKA
ncbi:MAG: UvrD-helicase domain-containing protein [Pseudomonadota bacterium]|nr:UvrD-helicase domain-containing protein [Pseudomonadota bacterium]